MRSASGPKAVFVLGRPPGVGKARFAEMCAGRLKRSFRRLDMTPRGDHGACNPLVGSPHHIEGPGPVCLPVSCRRPRKQSCCSMKSKGRSLQGSSEPQGHLGGQRQPAPACDPRQLGRRRMAAEFSRQVSKLVCRSAAIATFMLHSVGTGSSCRRLPRPVFNERNGAQTTKQFRDLPLFRRRRESHNRPFLNIGGLTLENRRLTHLALRDLHV